MGLRDAVLARRFGNDDGAPAIWPGYEDLRQLFVGMARRRMETA